MDHSEKKFFFRKCADAAVSGAFGILDMFPRRYVPEEIVSVTYEDLLAFANKCLKEYPETVVCRVVCIYEQEKKKYRITQFALNSERKALSDGDNFVARMFYANTIDRQIAILTKNQETSFFDISLR